MTFFSISHFFSNKMKAGRNGIGFIYRVRLSSDKEGQPVNPESVCLSNSDFHLLPFYFAPTHVPIYLRSVSFYALLRRL